MADRITLEHALTDNPVWQMVYVAEPMREIEVKMTYAELMSINRLFNNPYLQWISVNDRLPDKEGWYLTVVPNIHMEYYYMTCKFDGKFPSDVIAWMPIVIYEVKDGK